MASRALVPLFAVSHPTAHHSHTPQVPPPPRPTSGTPGTEPRPVPPRPLDFALQPSCLAGPKFSRNAFLSSRCRRPWTQEPRHHLKRILCSGQDACPAPSHLRGRDTPSAPPGHPLPFSEGLADPCSLCWCLLFLLPVLNCVSSHL